MHNRLDLSTNKMKAHRAKFLLDDFIHDCFLKEKKRKSVGSIINYKVMLEQQKHKQLSRSIGPQIAVVMEQLFDAKQTMSAVIIRTSNHVFI